MSGEFPGRLSGERLNSLADTLTERMLAMLEMLVTEMLDSGYPVGSEPIPPAEQYQRLSVLAAAGGPMFTPAAAADLQRLRAERGYPRPAPIP